MKKRTVITTTLAIFAVSACAGDERLPPPAPERPPVIEETLPTVPVDHPDVEALQVFSRNPRRLSVDQLEASLDRIAGLPPGSVRLPEDLAFTLGRPDYLRVTKESLEPSPLFMKFMVDLGKLICDGIRDVDVDRPQAERTLVRYDDRDQNLRHLLVIFTGIEGSSADEYVERLGRVYEAGAQSPRGAEAGWEAVCIAVSTSPEFLLY